ncbi:MAG TPA: serine hydrolase, partial [Rhizobium sp.]
GLLSAHPALISPSTPFPRSSLPQPMRRNSLQFPLGANYARFSTAIDNWWPHTTETFHTLHSATKSFVGTAVGFAVAENLVKLDDKVMAFFPEFVPGNTSEHLAAMTIADLLTMRSGHEFGLSGGEWRLLKTSWVAQFFKAAVTRPPGQSFIYSSASSHILSAIVQRASGAKVRDFLEPRLFGPLGITDLVWDDDPDGISAGGNGLKLKLADFLKWGIVHLQGGVWDGKQVVPAAWIKAAVQPHVPNIAASVFDGKRYQRTPEKAEIREGYGYHIWCGPDSSYYASGMFGQKCVVLPRQNAVVAINAAMPNDRNQQMLRALFDTLLGAGDEPDLELGRLGRTVRAVAADQPAVHNQPGDAWKQIEGNWHLEPNVDGLEALNVKVEDDGVKVAFSDKRGENALVAGFCGWRSGASGISTGALHHSYQEDAALVRAAAYEHQGKLIIDCYFVETPFLDTFTFCDGDGSELYIERKVNINGGPTSRPLYRAHRVG